MWFLFAFGPYFLAEGLQLSGIMAVLFCGIVMSHYTHYNLTPVTQVTVQQTMRTVSFLAGMLVSLTQVCVSTFTYYLATNCFSFLLFTCMNALIYRDCCFSVHWNASVHHYNIVQLQSNHLESHLDSDWSSCQHLPSLLPCQSIQDSQHQSQNAVHHVVLW